MSPASIGADLGRASPGPSVRRIRGSMYRRIGPAEGIDGAMPKFAKIYLFDTEAADVRISHSGRLLRMPALFSLHAMMANCNPFPRLFMGPASRMGKAGHGAVRLILRTDDDGLCRWG